MFLLVLHQQIGQCIFTVGVGRTDGDHSFGIFLEFFEFFFGLAQKFEILSRLFAQELSLFCKLQTLWGTVHDRYLKL